MLPQTKGTPHDGLCLSTPSHHLKSAKFSRLMHRSSKSQHFYPNPTDLPIFMFTHRCQSAPSMTCSDHVAPKLHLQSNNCSLLPIWQFAVRLMEAELKVSTLVSYDELRIPNSISEGISAIIPQCTKQKTKLVYDVSNLVLWVKK